MVANETSRPVAWLGPQDWLPGWLKTPCIAVQKSVQRPPEACWPGPSRHLEAASKDCLARPGQSWVGLAIKETG